MAERIRPRFDAYWIVGIAVAALALAVVLILSFGDFNGVEVACAPPSPGEFDWSGTLILAGPDTFTAVDQTGRHQIPLGLGGMNELAVWSITFSPDSRQIVAYVRESADDHFTIENLAVLSWDGVVEHIWPIGSRQLGGWISATHIALSRELDDALPGPFFSTEVLDITTGEITPVALNADHDPPAPTLEEPPLWTMFRERYSFGGRYVFYRAQPDTAGHDLLTLWDQDEGRVVWGGDAGLLLTYNPQWHPSNAAIAFVVDQPIAGFGEGDAENTLSLVTVAGEEMVLSEGLVGRWLRWSPDGGRLAFWWQPQSATSAQRLQWRALDTRSFSDTRLAHCFEMTSSRPQPNFVWGPEGNRMAYTVRTTIGNQVRFLDLATGHDFEVYEGASELVGWVGFEFEQ